MDDDFTIEKAQPVISRATAVDRDRSRKRKKRERREEAGRHFQELAETAEQAHAVLSRNRSPYRFCVYQQNQETFIDVVIVDAEGNIQETYRRNITHDEFQSWITSLAEESGLIIDRKA